MVDVQESLEQCHESDNSAPHPEVTSLSPDRDGSSVFGESKLGEPLVAQRLVLDFTPMEEIDNEIVQKKCCAFWDYINSRTDLHDMLVLPDEKIDTKGTDGSVVTSSGFMPTRISKQQKTAVSMLEVVEEKGLIDRIFEAKLQQTNCSLGSREYLPDESTKPEPTKTTCTCSTICKLCRNAPKQRKGPASRVQALCHKLQAWDTEHPKSMDPPGHAPVLTNCIMQRKVVM